MKKALLFHAFDYVRDDFLESAAGSMEVSVRENINLKQFGIIAACLLLAIGIVFGAMAQNDTPELILEHRILEKAERPWSVGGWNATFHDFTFGNIYEHFDCGSSIALSRWTITVEADIAEILPDAYTDPVSGMPYRIIRFYVNDVIAGENVPTEFYFRLEESLSCELEQFDRFIIGIKQVGVENYPMYNETQGQFEGFSLLFETSNLRGAEYGAFIAFDGEFDHGLAMTDALWKLDGWYDASTDYIGEFRHDYAVYPFENGDSLNAVKSKIKKFVRENPCGTNMRVYTVADFHNERTASIFDYINSVENGIFTQKMYRFDGDLYLHYTLYINGFETPQNIELVLNEHGNAKVGTNRKLFTDEDMASVPELAPILETLDFDAITPPHTENIEDFEVYSCHASGFYARKNKYSEMFGVIKIRWQLVENNAVCYDDLYILVSVDGTQQTVERDQLPNIIGENSNVVFREYNKPYYTLNSGVDD